ncbi:MAG: DUF6702 family protein [Bacteroidota bacterium]
MKYLLLLSFLNFLQPTHDVAMAVFAVTLEEDGTFQLKIKLDVEDLNTALALGPTESPTTELLTTYLQENTSWFVNNQSANFHVISVTQNEGFYLLEAAPIQFKTPFTSIELKNTVLLEQVDQQSNVIYIKQEGKEVRGFRMTKERVEVSVDL